jgi:AcrR family transcriptional regulator
MQLRERILTHSRDILIKEGLAGLSMRRIASGLEVSATAIYGHFSGKDELLLTLIEESVNMLTDRLREVAESQADPLDKLRGMAEAYVDFGLARPQEYEIMFAIRPEEMPRYPKEKFREVRAAYDLIAQAIREAVVMRMLEEDEPDLAAYSIWAQLHGVVSVILNRRLDNRIDRDAFKMHAIDRIIQPAFQQT